MNNQGYWTFSESLRVLRTRVGRSFNHTALARVLGEDIDRRVDVYAAAKSFAEKKNRHRKDQTYSFHEIRSTKSSLDRAFLGVLVTSFEYWFGSLTKRSSSRSARVTDFSPLAVMTN